MALTLVSSHCTLALSAACDICVLKFGSHCAAARPDLPCIVVAIGNACTTVDAITRNTTEIASATRLAR